SVSPPPYRTLPADWPFHRLEGSNRTAMDYNDFELAAFWVLCFAAVVPLVILGVLVHLRCGARARGWYLFLGCFGSIVYGLFAGGLVNTMFPPPYVQGLSEGRGLDLRGVALILGSWAGG